MRVLPNHSPRVGGPPEQSRPSGSHLQISTRRRGNPRPATLATRAGCSGTLQAQPFGAAWTAELPTAMQTRVLQRCRRSCRPWAPELRGPCSSRALRSGRLPQLSAVPSPGPARSGRLCLPLPLQTGPGGGVSLCARPLPPPPFMCAHPSPARPYVCVTARHSRPPTSPRCQRGLTELRTRAAPLKVPHSLSAPLPAGI